MQAQRSPPLIIRLDLWLLGRAFTRHLFVFLLLSSICVLKEERLSALSLVENLHSIRVSYYFYPEPNDSANRNDLLVEPMDKMCGIVVVVGLALSGCATKTPEKPDVAPPPAAVQEAPPEVAHPAPENWTVRYEAAPANASADSHVPAAPESVQSESETSLNQNRAEQCRKELDVLKVYNKVSYNKYEAEYQAIAAKTAKYMEIKDSLGPDLNYMVMPAYQFQIREFCFRVKTRLSELVLRQAK